MANEQSPSRDHRAHFDRWAPGYDDSVQDIANADLYPFAGYDQVLAGICREMDTSPGMTVLDVGTGTGNLARLLLERGCRTWGTDLSAVMLENARAKIPGATLIEADLCSTWPASIDGPFDRVVSAYVLHEFDLDTKLMILEEAAKRLEPAGRIIIGDVAFSTRSEHDGARQRWHDRWDHSEHYWIADEAIEAVGRIGLTGRWIEISICGGLFVLEPEATGT